MNIAFFCDSYIPVSSGAVVSIETLRLELEKRGHRVFIFCPKYKTWDLKDPRVCRMKTKFASRDEFRPLKYPVLSHTKDQLAKLKLDVVHCHSEYDIFDYGLKIAGSLGIPIVQTYYKIFPYEIKLAKKFNRSAYHASVKKLINYSKQCDKIIALSQTQRKILQNLGVMTPIDIIPVGVFAKDHVAVPKGSLKKDFEIKEDKIILYVGSLEENGNFTEVLKAFRKIYKTMDDVHLLVIGAGSKSTYFKLVSEKLGLENRITYTGILPKNVVNKIYGAVDLLVYPKTLDPQPLVVTESLAAGTPVVAQAGAGAQDFVFDNVDGLIAENNPQDLAEKIMMILKRDRLRLDLSIKARLNAQDYRSSKLTGDLLELYESLIS